MKSKVDVDVDKLDKLDVDKLVPAPVNLSKISGEVKNDVVKKTEFDELVKKVNTIQTTDNSNLLKNPDYNKKLIKLKRALLEGRCLKMFETQKDHRKSVESLTDFFKKNINPVNIGFKWM